VASERAERAGASGQGRATVVSELDLPTIAEAVTDRHEALALMDRHRAATWLVRNEFGYVITRYEDCVAILRDRRFFSAAGLVAQLEGVTDPEFLRRSERPSILSMEGADHSRLRRLVAPAFTPKAADRLRPFMREVIEGLVAAVAPTGRCELVADVCEPYPIPIICELLGAPKEDWKQFSVWASDLLRVFNGNLVEDAPIIMRTQDELDEYVLQLIDERRSRPAEDLLTALIAAEEDGDRLGAGELVSMVEAVIVGGTDTTRNQLGCTVALFAGHPDQWALLAEQPELAARAVEESMRYLGAIRGTARYASEDIGYRDIVFPAGTFVFPSFTGANYDPASFADPHEFDIRKPAPAAPQLTFGSGIHYCLGASLARAELQEALPILARRMPDLALDGDITWKPETFGIWGPLHLPLRFTPT
jgi:cytochrome P450